MGENEDMSPLALGMRHIEVGCIVFALDHTYRHLVGCEQVVHCTVPPLPDFVDRAYMN